MQAMITFPIHTRKIASLQYDPDTHVLWAVYRSGRVHSVGRLRHLAVMDLVCRLPLATSPFIRPAG